MKKSAAPALILLTALSLATAAHADAIVATPFEVAGGLVREFLPWLLVAAVVIVTIVLLLKFRKKK